MVAEIEASVRFVIFFDEIRYLRPPQILRHILEVSRWAGLEESTRDQLFTKNRLVQLSKS